MAGERMDGKDLWVGQAGGDAGSLEPGQVTGWFVEIVMRRGFDAIDPLPHLAYVEIHFEDAFLPPHPFDHKGKIGFQRLPEPAPALPEKDVLCHLLADGAGAMQRLALLVVFHRLFDGLEIEAVMIGEELVFGADDRQLGVGRDILHRYIAAFESFAPEYAAQLGQSDGWIDPFQEEKIK